MHLATSITYLIEAFTIHQHLFSDFHLLFTGQREREAMKDERTEHSTMDKS